MSVYESTWGIKGDLLCSVTKYTILFVIEGKVPNIIYINP